MSTRAFTSDAPKRAAAPESVAVVMVEVETLLPDLDQPRKHFDEKELTGLAQGFGEVGVLQPVRARRLPDGTLTVVAGERRCRAAKLAGLSHVPVIVEPEGLDEADILQRQLIENCHRQDLNPIEKMQAVERYKAAAGLTQAEAARKLSVSDATLSRLAPLGILPIPLQDAIRHGKVPALLGYEIARVSDPAEREVLAGQAVAGTLTRKSMAAKRDGVQATGAAGHSPRRRRETVTAPLGAGRSVTVTAPELSVEGVIEVLEELIGLAQRSQSQGHTLGSMIDSLRQKSRSAQRAAPLLPFSATPTGGAPC